jgi:serine/threonine protein kinase
MAQRRGQTNWTYLFNTEIAYSTSKEDFLGQGSSGSVRRGLFKGNKVAVKKVLKDMSAAPIKEKREIYLQGQLKHINVLPIIATTEDEEFRYTTSALFRFLVSFFYEFEYVFKVHCTATMFWDTRRCYQPNL